MARILLLDDDLVLSKLIVQSLELADLGECVHFDALQGAYDYLEGNEVDLAIVDLFFRKDEVLKKKGGLTFISKMRQIERKPLPIIAISGAFDASFGVHLKTSAKTLGATAVLSKPFHPDDLVSLVRRLLAEGRTT
ncbi:MAG: response regulator [Litoreibacter sp.]|nr:response regulator [Litoreibacter sp.]